MKWFKHDTDANMDAKLQEVMLDYGLEGYGLYWYCIELIAQRVNGDNLTFELEHDCRIIARNTGSTPQKVEQMMKSFINLGLLNADNGHVFCLKLASRCDDFTAKAVRRNGVKPVKNQEVGVCPSLSVFVPLEEEEEVRNRSKKNIKDKITKSAKANNEHVEIFDHWKSVMGKSNNSVLNEKRIKALTARLKEGYTVEQIKMAITGCSMTPHNMGQNNNGKKYDELELICRDGSQVERFASNTNSIAKKDINTIGKDFSSPEGWHNE